jgi:hypothetical protein
MKITITLTDGQRQDIEAINVAGFAVHQSIEAPCLVITHIPTGGAMYHAETLETATKLAQILATIEINGVSIALLPACDFIACMPAIYEHIKKLVPRHQRFSDGTKERLVNKRELQENIQHASEILCSI